VQLLLLLQLPLLLLPLLPLPLLLLLLLLLLLHPLLPLLLLLLLPLTLSIIEAAGARHRGLLLQHRAAERAVEATLPKASHPQQAEAAGPARNNDCCAWTTSASTMNLGCIAWSHGLPRPPVDDTLMDPDKCGSQTRHLCWALPAGRRYEMSVRG
jgi:hypothetical protein